MNKTITIIGGPVAQPIDPVLNLTPTGSGRLAARIANEFEKHFKRVERIGNFPGGKKCDFQQFEQEINGLKTNVVIFMAHLPNILAEFSDSKIRLGENELGVIKAYGAPKLVQRVKKMHPEVLLIPFKLADPDQTRVEIIRWMLELHAGLAVYSRLGDSKRFWIIDALGNEIAAKKKDLPQMLAEEVKHFLKAIRRRSERKGDTIPPVPYLGKFVDFSRRMQPAFSQIISGNVSSGRWPGNFSFRCTHGFLSSRARDGFIITRRNVDKTGLTDKDFVFVESQLKNKSLAFYGREGLKPSIDAPVHRVIYAKLPWVKHIIHGHLHVSGNCIHGKTLTRWPCGAENEGNEIVAVAPKNNIPPLWIVNIDGHGFVALISEDDPEKMLHTLSRMDFRPVGGNDENT